MKIETDIGDECCFGPLNCHIMFMQWNNCDFHFISIKVVKIPIISHIWFKGFNKYMIFHSYSFFLLGTSIIWHGNNFYSNMLIFPLEVRVFYIFTSFKSSSNRFLCLSYGWISSRFIYFYSWNPHIYFCLFDILGLLIQESNYWMMLL